MSIVRFALFSAVLASALFWFPSTPAAAQETVAVAVGDSWFCDASFQGGVCTTTVNAGDTVRWNFGGSVLPHTTTACGASCDSPTASPLWDSGLIADGATYQYTFTEPGTYLYYCQVHPFLQRGTIIVQGGPSGSIGDVNCNSSVNSIDAALVLQLSAGLVGSLSCQQNADTNANGTINSIDAALILQFVAGFIGTLPP